MRIGLIGDIHGNLIALDTVLTALEKERPDQVICLGDLSATGPQPREVLARIRDLGCKTVQGNWDAWMVEVRAGSRSYGDCRAIDRWCAEQLKPSDLDYLKQLPFTLEVALEGCATMLCFHGSPLSYNDVIEPFTSDDELFRMLGGRSATVLAHGHTHTQTIRRVEAGFLINPGSISECWDFTVHEDDKPFSPWAEFAMLDWSNSRPQLTLHRVNIDVAAVIRGAEASGMAGAAEWIALWRQGHNAAPYLG
jgi:putative phosphoesterase